MTTTGKWGTDRGKIVVLVYNKKKRRGKGKGDKIYIYIRINVTSNEYYRLRTSPEGSIFISKQLLGAAKKLKINDNCYSNSIIKWEYFVEYNDNR